MSEVPSDPLAGFGPPEPPEPNEVTTQDSAEDRQALIAAQLDAISQEEIPSE